MLSRGYFILVAVHGKKHLLAIAGSIINGASTISDELFFCGMKTTSSGLYNIQTCVPIHLDVAIVLREFAII